MRKLFFDIKSFVCSIRNSKFFRPGLVLTVAGLVLTLVLYVLDQREQNRTKKTDEIKEARGILEDSNTTNIGYALATLKKDKYMEGLIIGSKEDEKNAYGVDLSNAEWTEVNAKNIKFTKINFTEAKLDSTHFEDSYFSNVNFTGADMTCALFSHTRFYHKTVLHRAILSGASFRDVRMKDVNMSNVKRFDLSDSLSGSYKPFCTYNFFKKSDIEDVDFKNSKLPTARFLETELYEVIFSGANMEKVNFYDSKLKTVDFINSKLPEATFLETELYKVNFSDAVMIKVKFTDSMLSNVTFKNTDLKNSEFKGSLLKDVDFTGVRNLEFGNNTSNNLEDAWVWQGEYHITGIDGQIIDGENITNDQLLCNVGIKVYPKSCYNDWNQKRKAENEYSYTPPRRPCQSICE